MKNNKKVTIFICIILVLVSGIFYIRSNIDSAVSDIEMLSSENSNYKISNDETLHDNEAFGDENSNNLTSGKKILNKEILNKEVSNKEISDNSTASIVTVYICGAIKRPGVYDFSQGSRICDAVEKAGGFKKSAAKMKINLADILLDGQQIIVLTKKQAAKQAAGVMSGAADSNTNISDSTDTSDKSGLVNINTADKNQLMTLSGIGESKADAIIAYRQKSLFNSIEDIKNVSGIKDGVYNQIKDNITV